MTASPRLRAAFGTPKTISSAVITGCMAAAWLISANDFGLPPEATHGIAGLFVFALLLPIAMLLRKPLMWPAQTGLFLVFAVSYGVVPTVVAIAAALLIYALVSISSPDKTGGDDGQDGSLTLTVQDDSGQTPTVIVMNTVTTEKKYGPLTVRRTKTVSE